MQSLVDIWVEEIENIKLDFQILIFSKKFENQFTKFSQHDIWARKWATLANKLSTYYRWRDPNAVPRICQTQYNNEYDQKMDKAYAAKYVRVKFVISIILIVSQL